MDKLKNICISNGYCIIIKPINKGCLVEFPENILVKPNINAKIKTYLITEEGIDIYTEIDKKVTSQSLTLSKFAVRPIIIGDILREANKLLINEELIFIQVDDVFLDTNDIFKIIDIELLEDEEKEQKLLKLLPLLIIGKEIKLNADNDIQKEYNILLDFFTKGELR